MPYKVFKENGRYCVHKMNGDMKGDKVACHGTPKEANDQVKALYANENLEAPIENLFEELSLNIASDFIFTDLMEELANLSEIDGMAPGSFTTMHGVKVKFPKKDLSVYVKNTLKVLESTRGKDGEIVGLPIDLGNHDHQGGAGWIVGMYLDEARSIIRFMVNWTKAGVEAIKNNVSRFFSPSINPENKTILGGSLTNYPATRNEQGEILLRPVELSLSIKELSMSDEQKDVLEAIRDGFGKLGEFITGKQKETSLSKDDDDKSKTVELTVAEKEELKKQYIQELSTSNLSVTELLKSPAVIGELARQADEIAKNRLNAEMRKNRAVEFVAEMTGGSEGSPYGLAIPSEELVALMLSLPDAQMQAVEKVLRVARKGAIDFSQHGVDGVYPVKPQLPAEIIPLAQSWVSSGKSIDEFMAVNVEELGDPKQYDLSAFRKKEKE